MMHTFINFVEVHVHVHVGWNMSCALLAYGRPCFS